MQRTDGLFVRCCFCGEFEEGNLAGGEGPGFGGADRGEMEKLEGRVDEGVEALVCKC